MHPRNCPFGSTAARPANANPSVPTTLSRELVTLVGCWPPMIGYRSLRCPVAQLGSVHRATLGSGPDSPVTRFAQARSSRLPIKPIKSAGFTRTCLARPPSRSHRDVRRGQRIASHRADGAFLVSRSGSLSGARQSTTERFAELSSNGQYSK